MPRVSDAHREARRDRIRAAALRSFAAKGYQRTSIADVVAESGLSAGAIYGHYAGKQELFAAVAEDMLGRRVREISAASSDGGPPSPYEVLVILTSGMVRDVGDSKVLLQMWSESTMDPQIQQIVQELAATLAAVVRDALSAWFATRPDLAPDGADAAAEALRPALMGMGQAFVLQRALLDDFHPDAYLASVRALLPG